MFATLVRRAAQSVKPQMATVAEGAYTPYKLKKVWPPDMQSMSPQRQLHFEKKYKRRLALASARPRWDKYTKVAQLVTTTFVVFYMFLFMDWKDFGGPIEPMREKFWSFFGVFVADNRNPKIRDYRTRD